MYSSIYSAALTLCTFFAAAGVSIPSHVNAAPSQVVFGQTASSVEAYDYLEVTVNVAAPDARNPFTDVLVGGSFQTADARKRWSAEGFCDSPDGSMYRIRF